MSFKSFKIKAISFYLFISTTPLVAMLLFILFYLYNTKISSSGLLIIPAVALIAVNLAGSAAFSLYISKSLEKAAGKLIEVFDEDEVNALKKGAMGSNYTLLLSSMDYFKEKQHEIAELKEAKRTLQIAREYSVCIIWRRNADGYSYDIPEYWKKAYPCFKPENNIPITDYIAEEHLKVFNASAAEAEDSVSIYNTEKDYGHYNVKSSLSNVKNINIQVKLRVSESRYIWAEIDASAFIEKKNVCLAGAITDVNYKYEAQREADNYRNRYNFVLAVTDEIIYEIDYDMDRFLIATPHIWEKLLDISIANPVFSVQRKLYWEKIHPDFREGFLDRFFNMDHLSVMPDSTLSYEYRLKNKNGDYVWVEHTISIIDKDNGKAKKSIGKIVDISERKRRELKKTTQSAHDSLTGAFLRSVMRAEFNEYSRDNKDGALIVIKLNGLEYINDQYGHNIGDLALRSVVNACWEAQKKQCSVGRGDGDTFVVFVKGDEAGAASVEAMAERIVSKYDEPVKLDKYKVNLDVTAGIAFYGTGGGDFEKVCLSAETAMNEETQIKNGKISIYIGEQGEQDSAEWKSKYELLQKKGL